MLLNFQDYYQFQYQPHFKVTYLVYIPGNLPKDIRLHMVS